jgi:hypothetical protein
VLPPGPPGFGDHRVVLAPAFVEGGELLLGGLDVRGAVDRFQLGGDEFAVLVGDVAHRAADLVDDAGLHPGLGEDGLDRFWESGQPVDAAVEDVLCAALVEVVEHREPELRPSVSCHQIPRTSRSPSTVTPIAS